MKRNDTAVQYRLFCNLSTFYGLAAGTGGSAAGASGSGLAAGTGGSTLSSELSSSASSMSSKALASPA